MELIIPQIAQILLALIVLSVLVVVHELGHFLAAKKIGVWAEEFGIGLPPRVWGKKFGDTVYSVNALPIGGFVRLHGEVGEEGEKIKFPEKAFINKKALPRIFVAVAGVLMNILFAVLCFSLIHVFIGAPQNIVISEVAENSPAQELGLRAGDEVYYINDRRTSHNTFSLLVERFKGNNINVTYKNADNKIISNEVFLRSEAPDGEGLMGVRYSYNEPVYPKWFTAPFEYLRSGLEQTLLWVELTVIGFGRLFSDLTVGKTPEGVMGPVGITATIANTLQDGAVSILGLAGIISINLALINILPFPPLDGSRVMFIAGEEIFGKKFIRKHEAKLHLAGMAVLLLLIVAMTIKEVPALINAGSISGFVESMLQ